MAGLNNFEIDNYLKRNLKTIHFIPSQSYDSLFGVDGSLKYPIPESWKSWCCCINTDTKIGPGQHWVGIVCYPLIKQVFYYDSLLANKEYPVPHNVKMFLSKCSGKGYTVFSNDKMDQKRTVQIGGKRMDNDMCGAYVVDLFLMMDKSSDPSVTFASEHKKQGDKSVYHLFKQIKHT